MLNFESLPVGYRDLGCVGPALNVGGLNYNGITLYTYMSPSMFDDIYTIVRTENPVKVHWGYKDMPSNPSSTTKLVTYVTVGTGQEIPGEGDADSNAAAALLLDSIAIPA